MPQVPSGVKGFGTSPTRNNYTSKTKDDQISRGEAPGRRQRGTPGQNNGLPGPQSTQSPPTNDGATNYPAPSQNGTYQAQSGFGKQFTIPGLADIFENPGAFTSGYFNYNNLDPYGGQYRNVRDLAENLGILWLLSQGNDTVQQGNAGYADWASGAVDSAMKPGGTFFGPNDVFAAILNAGQDSVIGQKLNNPLMDYQDQVSNVISTLRAALEPTVPAPILDILVSSLAYEGEKGLAGNAMGKEGTFLDAAMNGLLGNVIPSNIKR